MYEKELTAMMEAALEAEKVIKAIYKTPFEVEIKSDDSPVTQADKQSDQIIRDFLHNAFPNYAFLTEESQDTKERLNNDYVFIIDPVDGTKEFVARNGEFTTNIALAYKHEVVAGVINIPILDTMYYAIKGQGSFRKKKGQNPERIHVSERSLYDLRVLISRSFFNDKEKEYIEKYKANIGTVEACGAAYKFCRIAEGTAELSYRTSDRTKEWDVAAGDIILTEAGGVMLKPDLTAYTYNRDDVYNREGYILANRKENILI